MKVIAFAFLLAVASATPNRYSSGIEKAVRSGSERLVTGNIVKAIEDAAQSIRDAGLDPLDRPPTRLEYALPVDSVFNGRVHHNGIYSRGLSNIVINRMNYAVITSRLTFNIELPSIRLDIHGAEVDLNILGGNFNSKISGSFEIRNIVVTGDIRVSIGVLTGISIRSIDMTFRLGGIQSYLNVEAQNFNLSRYINELLGQRLPNALTTHQKDIDTLITIVAKDVIEANL